MTALPFIADSQAGCGMCQVIVGRGGLRPIRLRYCDCGASLTRSFDSPVRTATIHICLVFIQQALRRKPTLECRHENHGSANVMSAISGF